MPEITIELIEETLRKEVQKIDKSVQVVAVEHRVTLLKDRKSGRAELKKDVIKQYLSQEGKGKELRRALGKAVSHLSIRYKR